MSLAAEFLPQAPFDTRLHTERLPGVTEDWGAHHPALRCLALTLCSYRKIAAKEEEEWARCKQSSAAGEINQSVTCCWKTGSCIERKAWFWSSFIFCRIFFSLQTDKTKEKCCYFYPASIEERKWTRPCFLVFSSWGWLWRLQGRSQCIRGRTGGSPQWEGLGKGKCRVGEQRRECSLVCLITPCFWEQSFEARIKFPMTVLCWSTNFLRLWGSPSS